MPENVRDRLASLEHSLALERERRSRVERAKADLEAGLARERERYAALASLVERLEHDLQGAEATLAGSIDGMAGAPGAWTLDGKTVLLVGGHTALVPHGRHLVEQRRGRFLHHDGGTESSCTQIGGLVSQADIVLVPVDCVSHEAAGRAKRAAQQLGKSFVPIHRTGLGSIARALSSFANAAAAAI